MKTKLLEIRDRNTMIPAMATQMYADNTEQHFLLRHAGYSMDEPLILLHHMQGLHTQYDCYSWGAADRTMPVAHRYIQENWKDLKDGDVVDVEFILKESGAKKLSERVIREKFHVSSNI